MTKSAYLKFKKGDPLTRKQAMGAQCYECNGYSMEKTQDCQGYSCPLYQWSPWGKNRVLRNVDHPKRVVGRSKKEDTDG